MVKILIIDDKSDNLVSMSALLKNIISDSLIITADSGKKGIKAAISEQPDTILLDVIMPEMDGYQVCKSLKTNLKTKHIPVIMITAIKRDSESLIRGLESGADNFLQKPIDADELKAQVNVMLRIKKAEDNMRENQRDLTKTVRESEEKFQMLIEQSNDAIYLLHDNKFEIINSRFIELFGYSREECRNENFNFRKLIAPKSIKFIEDRNEGIRQGEEIKQIYEFTALNKEGIEIECEVSTSYINYKGSKAVQGIIRDIGERLKMEKEKQKLKEQLIQSQKMEAIGTLAGGIAHDFNNILGVIMGYTELTISETGISENIKKNLEHVLQASERAKDMVKQILTFSRKTEQSMKPISIGNIIKEAVSFLRSSIPTTIEIKSSIEENIGLIFGNSTQINQVLMNLCTNAAHAMEKVGGLLEISLKQIILDQHSAKTFDLISGKYLQLNISDTGTGIDQEIIDRIFEPFFTTKKSGEGTGMGLSVVYGIIKNHKGTIKVYSEPGTGTIMNVYLPIFEINTSESLDAVQEYIHIGNNENILFVDDEKGLVNLGNQILTSLGYSAEVRTSSIEALEAFKADPDKFDLLITDMTMPNMTGTNLAAEIHKIKPDIPVILCTGFSSIINKYNFKNYGVDELIMKPLVKKELGDIIHNLLKKREK